MRLKDHVTQAFVEQRRHNSIVTGRLWQPQAFGFTAESVTKIGQPPANLGPQIAIIAERQNRVTVCLRDGVAVPAMPDSAFAICSDDAGIRVGMMTFNPTQQCRTEIETDQFIVVHKLLIAFRFTDADERVRAIALEMNAFVPIMKGRRAWLFFNDSRPRIFARRLIEVTMDD